MQLELNIWTELLYRPREQVVCEGSSITNIIKMQSFIEQVRYIEFNRKLRRTGELRSCMDRCVTHFSESE